MANIAVQQVSEALAVKAFVATTPAGDFITGAQSNQPLLLEFHNGHVSAITVNIAPVSQYAAPIDDQKIGRTAKPTVSLSIGAGADAVMCIAADLIRLYNDCSNHIPVSYTSGNAALTVRAIQPAR